MFKCLSNPTARIRGEYVQFCHDLQHNEPERHGDRTVCGHCLTHSRAARRHRHQDCGTASG